MITVLVPVAEDEHEYLSSYIDNSISRNEAQHVASQLTKRRYGREYATVTWQYNDAAWVFKFDDPKEAVLFKLRHA
jgi:hypothetical protein